MDRAASESPPRSWGEDYTLLGRIVEGAAKHSIFGRTKTAGEMEASIIELLRNDAEIAAIASRLIAGPPEFLDLLLLSPADLQKLPRFDKLVEEEVAPDASIADLGAAVDNVLASHPELDSERGYRYDQRLLLVQEAILRWNEESPPRPS